MEPDQATKSVGHEETYPRDLHRRADCELEVLRLSDAVASRLRAGDARGRTVTLKVRFGDFRTITRSATLARPTDSAREVARTARRLLIQQWTWIGRGQPATHKAAIETALGRFERFQLAR